MKRILNRLSPLAVLFVALAAVLALSSTANAQSTSSVQIHYVGIDGNPGPVISARPDGADLQVDNANDFRQRWDRETVSAGTFRFSRQGFINACLRAPDGVAASGTAPVAIGSCSGTRAQWRRQASPGLGDLYVNVGSGHVLSQPFCIVGPCDARVVVTPASNVPAFGESRFRWSLEFL